MSKIFIKYITLLSFINYILNDNNTNNNTTQINNIITGLNDIEHENRNNTTNKNKNLQIPQNVSNILAIENNNITTQKPTKNINDNNITIYDKNKILEIITNSSFSKSNDSKININIIDNDNITKLEEVENIVIQNTHEDQLAESIFYLLSFVLVIFIILFLYKFYKCYCQNTIKEFGEEGTTIKNPSNDPELQRISTSDEDNIMEVIEN